MLACSGLIITDSFVPDAIWQEQEAQRKTNPRSAT
jgi:hypothetical protein